MGSTFLIFSVWLGLLFSYWCSFLLGKPASDVFACPSAFSTNCFPPFYRDLLVAWKEVDGSFSERRSSLIFASSSPHHVAAVSCMTSKCVYSFLMSESRGDPHWVEKFLPCTVSFIGPLPGGSYFSLI